MHPGVHLSHLVSAIPTSSSASAATCTTLSKLVYTAARARPNLDAPVGARLRRFFGRSFEQQRGVQARFPSISLWDGQNAFRRARGVLLRLGRRGGRRRAARAARDAGRGRHAPQIRRRTCCARRDVRESTPNEAPFFSVQPTRRGLRGGPAPPAHTSPSPRWEARLLYSRFSPIPMRSHALIRNGAPPLPRCQTLRRCC